MASFRYRTKIPAEHIGASINEGSGDIIVFSKPMQGDFEIAKAAKDHGAKVVVDFCDPHFDTPLYQRIAIKADLIVCPTKEMANIVGRFFYPTCDKRIEIIPDPYEMPEVPPHANGDKFLWFGHNANLEDIKPHSGIPNLRIVSGPKVSDGITHWSPANIDRAMREANICLFPTRKGAEYKSPNRLLNALRMGLFPICQRHPSYEEFRGLAWVGEIATGTTWALHFKEDLNPLVREMQDKIRVKYSPSTIGETWKSVLESI